MELLKDNLGREISYVRISVTDRCNFRCVYCMPEEGVPFIDHSLIMSYEEILYLCRVFQDMGIKKIRFTGGEPLVRKGIIDFLRSVRQELPSLKIALTTNGFLLKKFSNEIDQLKLISLNISLDTLDQEKFKEITRCGSLDVVKESIIHFSKISTTPIKLNCVLMKGFNDMEIPELLSFARANNLILRFIEFMPLENEIWNQGGFMSSDEIINTINNYGNWTIQNIKDNSFDGPAKYYIEKETKQKIGIIAAVSHHFCASCNRLRVTALGELKPCLFSNDTVDLKKAIKERDYKNLVKLISSSIKLKPTCWKNIERSEKHMSQIGG